MFRKRWEVGEYECRAMDGSFFEESWPAPAPHDSSRAARAYPWRPLCGLAGIVRLGARSKNRTRLRSHIIYSSGMCVCVWVGWGLDRRVIPVSNWSKFRCFITSWFWIYVESFCLSSGENDDYILLFLISPNLICFHPTPTPAWALG